MLTILYISINFCSALVCFLPGVGGLVLYMILITLEIASCNTIKYPGRSFYLQTNSPNTAVEDLTPQKTLEIVFKLRSIEEVWQRYSIVL